MGYKILMKTLLRTVTDWTLEQRARYAIHMTLKNRIRATHAHLVPMLRMRGTTLPLLNTFYVTWSSLSNGYIFIAWCLV